MRRLARTAVAAAAIALFLTVGTAQAQFSATSSATATATISGVAPLTVTFIRNLNFGAVTAGAGPVTPAVADGAAWTFSGEPSQPVTVTFTLPSVLTGPGSQTIGITFASSHGQECTPFPTTCTSFDPTSVYATALPGPGPSAGLLDIGLIGQINPPALTVSGTYTGTITVTVSY